MKPLRDRWDRFAWWVAFHLPAWIVYHCAIRVWAHATSGRWSNVEAPAVTVADALKRWENDHANQQ